MKFTCEHVYIFIFILEVKRVLGQACIESQQSSCTQTDTSNILSLQSNTDNNENPFQGQIGIDFLPEFESNLDKHLYFGTTFTSQSRRNEIPIWNLVQNFIRDIKGAPKISTGNIDYFYKL